MNEHLVRFREFLSQSMDTSALSDAELASALVRNAPPLTAERREAPVQTPAPEKALLVRHARRMGGTAIELPASFELAAAMPEYLPQEMRQDAWKRAAQVAAGHALERKKTRPQEAALLEQLAEGALKQAAGLRPEAPEPRPVKRWRSAR